MIFIKIYETIKLYWQSLPLQSVLIVIIIIITLKFVRIKLNKIRSRFQRLKRKVLPLKWWFVFVGYAIALTALAVCVYCIVVYGAILGETLVIQWIIAFVIGVVKDAFVIDPIKVRNVIILQYITNQT